MTAGQRREIASIDLSSWSGVANCRIDLITSCERQEAAELVRRLRSAGRTANATVFPSNGNWAESDAFGSALIPQSIIQGVLGSVLVDEVSVV